MYLLSIFKRFHSRNLSAIIPTIPPMFNSLKLLIKSQNVKCISFPHNYVYHSFSPSPSVKVFRPDGSNGFNIFSESDARVEQYRNRGKKVSPRMR